MYVIEVDYAGINDGINEIIEKRYYANDEMSGEYPYFSTNMFDVRNAKFKTLEEVEKFILKEYDFKTSRFKDYHYNDKIRSKPRIIELVPHLVQDYDHYKYFTDHSDIENKVGDLNDNERNILKLMYYTISTYLEAFQPSGYDKNILSELYEKLGIIDVIYK